MNQNEIVDKLQRVGVFVSALAGEVAKLALVPEVPAPAPEPAPVDPPAGIDPPPPPAPEPAPAPPPPLANNRPFLGIALCGMQAGKQFTGNEGLNGLDYPIPGEEDYAWAAKEGFPDARVPATWEHAQPKLFGELDAGFVALVQQQCALGVKHGVGVLIDIHNFGTWGGWNLGSIDLPAAAFVDFCARMARLLKATPGAIGLQMMNEPIHVVGDWQPIAQAAADAYFAVAPDLDLYVNEPGWSSAMDVSTSFRLRDPNNRVVYCADAYGDASNSGTEITYQSETALFDRVKIAVDRWREMGVRGCIAEIGVPPDINSNHGFESMAVAALAHIRDAGMSAFWWAAGPMWQVDPAKPDFYPMSLRLRVGGVDAPQMSYLRQFLTGAAPEVDLPIDPPSDLPSMGSKIVDEGASFPVKAAGYVFWGSGSTFVEVHVNPGLNWASNEHLGSDPTPGVVKAVYRGTAEIGEAPVVPAGPVAGPPPVVIVPPVEAPPAAATPPAVPGQPFPRPELAKTLAWLKNGKPKQWAPISSINIATSDLVTSEGTEGQPDYRPRYVKQDDPWMWGSWPIDFGRSITWPAAMGGHGSNPGGAQYSCNAVGELVLEVDAPQFRLLIKPSLMKDRVYNSTTGYYLDAPAATHPYWHWHYVPELKKCVRTSATTVWGDGNHGALKVASFSPYAPNPVWDPMDTFPDILFNTGRDGTEVYVPGRGILLTNEDNLRALFSASTGKTEWLAQPHLYARSSYTPSAVDERRKLIFCPKAPGGGGGEPGAFVTDYTTPTWEKTRFPLTFEDPQFSEANPPWKDVHAVMPLVHPTDESRDRMLIASVYQVSENGRIWEVDLNPGQNVGRVKAWGSTNPSGIPIPNVGIGCYNKMSIYPRLGAIVYHAAPGQNGSWFCPIWDDESTAATPPVDSGPISTATPPVDTGTPAPAPGPSPAPAAGASADGARHRKGDAPLVLPNGDRFELGEPSGGWSGDYIVLRNGAPVPNHYGPPWYLEGEASELALVGGRVFSFDDGHQDQWRVFDGETFLDYDLGDPTQATRLVTNAKSGQRFPDVGRAQDSMNDGDTLLIDTAQHGDEYIEIRRPGIFKSSDPAGMFPLIGNMYGLNDHGKLGIDTSGRNPNGSAMIVVVDGMRTIGVMRGPDNVRSGVYTIGDTQPGHELDLTLRRSFISGHTNGYMGGQHLGAGSSLTLDEVWIVDCSGSDLTHAVYNGQTGKLTVIGAYIADNRGPGHGVKTRGRVTRIADSVLANFDSPMSCVLDVCGGGDVEVVDSVLHKGRNSDNPPNLINIGREFYVRMIGASEGAGWTDKVTIKRNLIVSDIDYPPVDDPNQPHMAFIDLALDRMVAQWNQQNPGLPPATAKMGPVVIEENIMVGRYADRRKSQYPINDYLVGDPAKYVKTIVDHRGRKSLALK